LEAELSRRKIKRGDLPKEMPRYTAERDEEEDGDGIKSGADVSDFEVLEDICGSDKVPRE
jgi:hypothetical protein